MTHKLHIHTRLLALAGFFLLTGYSSCDPILENNGFDLWCGDSLCTWEVDKGSVAQVPTWHTGDYGVALIGDEAAISQLVDIDSNQVSCVRFDLVVKADVNTEVTLELDYYGDGSVDHAERIPSSDWASVSFELPLPDSYQGIRFRVRKSGPGEVVLAQIYADEVEVCTGARAQLTDRPLGAWCASASECDSGVCTAEVTAGATGLTCSGCETDADCAGGQICGAAVPTEGPHLELYRACVDAGQQAFGQRCAADADCDTGICNDHVCSSCASNADCTGGGSCLPRHADYRDEDNFFVFFPFQCDAFEGGGQTGDPCLAGEDCASGACDGAGQLSVCELDGRTCANGDDCPDDLQCRNIGVAGGTCQ